MPRNRTQIVIWSTVLGLGVLSAGCGRGAAKLPVYGTATTAGGEKFNGSVSFLPEEGKAGSAAIASLIDGQYRFDSRNGPTPGPHQVIVTRNVSKAAMMQSTTGKAAPPGPAKTEWKLTITVPDKAPYQCDLKLE